MSRSFKGEVENRCLGYMHTHKHTLHLAISSQDLWPGELEINKTISITIEEKDKKLKTWDYIFNLTS